ncbi:unnamed protein product [Dovyalis caffra]|uniref:Protein kinase domain-containing protein n=1 Tax=Dovyalis caffra TaxID=77055 RepID=A0AAV1RQJ1_9ROSI|nr:unnamed protein product [Dovyalis caffra]
MKSAKNRTTNRPKGPFPGPKLPGKSGNSVSLSSGLADNVNELLRPEQMPVKIKLQLFPIDERTRVGLEKDGYHPYLELTLSARKKISSVLKHLNEKWGGSGIARGELVLHPYNVSEGLANKKWMLNDVNISAGEVYTAIGNPSVFRLSYGWFLNSGTKSVGVPSLSTTHDAGLRPQVMEKVCSIDAESTHGEVEQIEETRKEFKPSTSTGAMGVVLPDKNSSNGLIGPVDLSVLRFVEITEKVSDGQNYLIKGNETKTDVGTGQPSTLWDDGLTNISIGSLLSEASLQGMLNTCDPKSNGSNPGLQPTQLISDSLDAFIAAQVNPCQGPGLPQCSSSSILDAEDTCHAFAIKKLSALGKDCGALSGSAYSQTCSQDAGSKSSKHPTMTEVKNQSGLRQGLGFEESETELSLGSRVYNHENSLGLSGIKWTKNSTYSPPQTLEKLKQEYVYVKGESGGRPTGQREPGKLFRQEVEKKRVVVLNGAASVGEGLKNDIGNVSQRISSKKAGGDELVDGWPKWLVENIAREVLAGLVPKSADSYDKLAKVGQGTYSNVYKARDRDTGKIVALKKVRFDTSEPESVKFMAREITMLQKLDHPNVIKLEGLATSRMQYSLYLVFDCMQSDLTRIISRPGERLTEPQVKCYMQQLLSGLQHCHERGILHRDIKASNLLIDSNGMLKIADFGLANFFIPKPRRPLTSRVVTLWYRAPELLLGSTDYGVGIDLWSAGCLLAEMFIGRPIMPGRTEVEQLHRIFKLCGSPPEDYWKIMRLPTSFRPPQHYKPSFQEAFKDFPGSSYGLLTTLLALNPAYRGTAASALQSQQFFSSSPLACELSGLPVIYKEEDDPTEIYGRRKRRNSKKQLSRASRERHGRKNSISQHAKEETEASKEVEKISEPSMNNGLETGNSASSSTCSDVKPITRQEQHLRRPSFSPILDHSNQNQNRSIRTEAHPNATKNIQNFTLLQASITDIINHNGGNAMPAGYRRSVSTLDFRSLDPEKISKLFGLDKD